MRGGYHHDRFMLDNRLRLRYFDIDIVFIFLDICLVPGLNDELHVLQELIVPLLHLV